MYSSWEECASEQAQRYVQCVVHLGHTTAGAEYIQHSRTTLLLRAMSSELDYLPSVLATGIDYMPMSALPFLASFYGALEIMIEGSRENF